MVEYSDLWQVFILDLHFEIPTQILILEVWKQLCIHEKSSQQNPTVSETNDVQWKHKERGLM